VRSALRDGRMLHGKIVVDAAAFFDALDQNGNGSLSSDEIAEGFKHLDAPVTDDQVRLFMRYLDVNSNGVVERSELQLGLGDICRPQQEQTGQTRRSVVRATRATMLRQRTAEAIEIYRDVEKAAPEDSEESAKHAAYLLNLAKRVYKRRHDCAIVAAKGESGSSKSGVVLPPGSMGSRHSGHLGTTNSIGSPTRSGRSGTAGTPRVRPDMPNVKSREYESPKNRVRPEPMFKEGERIEVSSSHPKHAGKHGTISSVQTGETTVNYRIQIEGTQEDYTWITGEYVRYQEVEVQSGKYTGVKGTVVKVVRDGKDTRWRVRLLDRSETWVEEVKTLGDF